MFCSKRKPSIPTWELSRAVLEKWNQSSDEGALLREIKARSPTWFLSQTLELSL